MFEDEDQNTPVENEGTGTDSLAASGDESGESSGFNPAWEPLLEALPESLRNLDQIQNPLREWDKNYQSLQEKYKPFDSVPEQYRNPEALTAAVNILENLNTDPHQVLRMLAENLGVTLAEAKEIVEEVKPDPVADLDFSDDDDPRLKTMYDQNKALQERFDKFFENQTQAEQQRLQQQEEQKQGAEIDRQVKALIDAGSFGNSKEEQEVGIKGLMTRASIHIKAGSRDPIGDAWKDQQAEYAVIARQYQQKQSNPQNLLFMPTGGQAPPNAPTPPDLDSQEGRYQAALQIRNTMQRG